MSQLRKDLRAMCADGAAWSVMVGTGESYLPAFVLALTANQLACGLVATVPMVAGAILQLASPRLIRRFGSYRRWVVVCATIQAAAFLPLVAMALFGRLSLWLVFPVASVYWAAGLAATPSWNAWAETLVPSRIRPRFFARRARTSQMGLVLGFATGGLLLHMASQEGRTAAVFAALFLAAALSRLVSARFLRKQREPIAPEYDSWAPSPVSLSQSLRSNLGSRLLRFMLGMQLAVSIAGPYFTPYMFMHLRLSYAEFMVLICAAFLSKVVFLPAIGELCRQLGPKRVLWSSGTLIVALPALWLFSSAYSYLLALQILAGASWAAFELATLLLFFETIPRSKRIDTLTVFGFVHAAAIAIGSIAGGALLSTLGSTQDAYEALFVISSVARAGSLLLLAGVSAISLPAWGLVTRSLAVRPLLGMIERPVLPSLGRTSRV